MKKWSSNCISFVTRKQDTQITSNPSRYFVVPFPETWWRHQMEAFSALLAFLWGIHRSPVNSPNKGQWRGALMFSLICAWINGWVNNREAGVLRRHLAHNYVIVMNSENTTQSFCIRPRYELFFEFIVWKSFSYLPFVLSWISCYIQPRNIKSLYQWNIDNWGPEIHEVTLWQSFF